MAVAGDWPVLASYDELLEYAQSKGGRLPAEAELRLFLDTFDVGHEGGANVGFRNWHPVP
jgi:L-histidine Nalpha-methyltransferase / hercynylcysteine S-oxide synthase